MGHEDAFSPPPLSVRYQFSQGTFRRTRVNGRDAPSAVIPALAPERGSSIQTGPSLYRENLDRLATPQRTDAGGLTHI
jgi:hypothetical protein